MAKLIYRVVSACGALGYGYPKASLDKALEAGVDAIIVGGGAMDLGPYYLGAGKPYFERDAVKSDFRGMVIAGQKIDGPVIVGSCGTAGGNRNLQWMLDIAREVFIELGVVGAKIAVIPSEVEPEIIIQELRAGNLLPIDSKFIHREESLCESTIVGQMGIDPVITALKAGAKFIFAGRISDAALFAADMVRRGIDPGIAYHVGHVLGGGALACTPGSPSDCLVAEVYDDGSAVFVAPDPDRRCTPDSIAAHSLYKASHPQLQYYPEGVLVMEHSEFFAKGARSAGIRGSEFVNAGKPWPLSIKLEGARRVGFRKFSLLHIEGSELANIPDGAMVYGRKGVQSRHVGYDEFESGFVVETFSEAPEPARQLAHLLSHYLMQFGCPDSKETRARIVSALSPDVVCFRRSNESYGAVVACGTHNSMFLENYNSIKLAAIELIKKEFPQALTHASYKITEATSSKPVVVIQTVGVDHDLVLRQHRKEVDCISNSAGVESEESLIGLDAEDVYEWTLFHLLTNEALIKKQLFPINYFLVSGRTLLPIGQARSRYQEIGIRDYTGCLDEKKLSSVSQVKNLNAAVCIKNLNDMAVVIRTNCADINRLTLDVIFNSLEHYDDALRSNSFTVNHLARFLMVEESNFIGSYFVDSCRSIKITVSRGKLLGSPENHDAFDCRQLANIERMRIPIYPVER